MKTCCDCQFSLPKECFATRSKSKDGLQSRCRSCQSAYFQRWDRRGKKASKPDPVSDNRTSPAQVEPPKSQPKALHPALEAAAEAIFQKRKAIR